MDRSQQTPAQWGANVPQQQQSVGEMRYPPQGPPPQQQSQPGPPPPGPAQQQQPPPPPPPPSQQNRPPPSRPPPPPARHSQPNGGSTGSTSPPGGSSVRDKDRSNPQRNHTSTMTSPVPSPFAAAQQSTETQMNGVEDDVAVTVTQQNSPEDGRINCDNQVPNVEHRVCFPGQNPHSQPPQVNFCRKPRARCHFNNLNVLRYFLSDPNGFKRRERLLPARTDADSEQLHALLKATGR